MRHDTLIEKQKILIEFSSMYLDYEPSEVSYQEICDQLLALSGAEYVALDLLTPDRNVAKTIAFAGLGKNSQKVNELFSFNLLGKEWSIDHDSLISMRSTRLIKQGGIEVACPHLSNKNSKILKETFDIGDILSVGISKRDTVLGRLILILHTGNQLQYPELVEIFAQQVGSLLFRMNREKEWEKKLIKLQTITTNSPDLEILVNRNRKIQFINKELPGFEMNRVVGDDVVNYVFPEYHENYKEWLEEVFQSKKSLVKEVKAIGYHGAEAFYNVTFTPILDDDNVREVFIVASDITERKRMEVNLRENTFKLQEQMMLTLESEEKFRALSESSADAIMRFDRNKRHLYVNQAAQALTGIPVQDFIGRTHAELQFPEHLVMIWEAAIQKVFDTREGHRIEFQLPNGIWIDWALMPEFIWNDEVQSVMTSARDISGYKQVQEALLANEAQLKLQIQRMPVGHIMWSTDFRVISWNPEAEIIFEFTEAEMLGQHPYGFIVPKVAQPVVDEVWDRLLTGDKSAHSINPNLTKSGRIIICDWTNTPITDSEGNITSVMTMVSDITERVAAEDKIKASEERLNLAFQGAGDGMWDWDITSGHVFYSTHWEEMFGFSPGEIPKRLESMLPRVHPDDIDEMFEKVNKYLKKEIAQYAHEFRMFRKDGSIIWTLHRAAAIWDEQGKPLRMIGTTVDITDRKKSAEALTASERFLRETQLIANLGTYVLDIVAGTWTSSDVLDNIYGIDKDYERNFENWTLIIHPDWRETIIEYFQNEVLDKRSRFDKEFKIVRINDKTERWVHGIGNLKFNDSEQPINMVGTIQDITLQKKSEQKIKESEGRVKVIGETINDVFYLYNIIDNHYEYISKNCINILGASDDFFYNRNTYTENYILESDRKQAITAYNQIDSGLVSKVEYRIMINGETRWIREKMFPIKDEGGQVIRHSGVCTDITEYKKLASIDTRYRNLVEESKILICTHSLDGVILSVNKPGAQILGYTPEEIIGRKLDDFLPVEFQRDFETYLQHIMRYKSFEGFMTVLTKRGKKRIFLFKNTLITDSDHGEYILGSAQDVTEWRKAEFHQTKTKEELQLIISSMDDFVIEFDEQARFKNMWCRDEAKLFMPVSSFIGKTIQEAFSHAPKFAKEAQRLYDKVLKTGEVSTIEIEDIFSLEPLFYLARLNPVKDKNGHNIRCTGLVTNITAQKLAEESLKIAKLNAESANRAKSEFLANMSHEIRTPMNAILGFSEILSSKIIDPKMKLQLDHITKAGNNLLTLINDILDLSKIEASRMEIIPVVINLKEFANELRNIFSAFKENRNIVLQINVSSALPTNIQIDIIRLRQILFNLVGNAFKFTREGRIAVSLSLSENGREIIFEITDTGIGIPVDQHELIFHAFRQQDGQSTRKFGGTGLGLTITKRLVEMMGGTISLHSAIGKGSTFTVMLPFTNPPAYGVIESENPSVQYEIEKEVTILIAEDNEANRILMREVLNALGFNNIIEVENGADAVQAAIREIPDIIFMDLMMPVMNGYEANQRIKENHTTEHIPIIAWTAAGLKSDEEKIKNEFTALLRKPTRLDEVEKILIMFAS